MEHGSIFCVKPVKNSSKNNYIVQGISPLGASVAKVPHTYKVPSNYEQIKKIIKTRVLINKRSLVVISKITKK